MVHSGTSALWRNAFVPDRPVADIGASPHCPWMRITNILTIVAVAIWGAIMLLGRTLLVGVEAQQAPGYPSLGQIDWLIIGPFGVIAFLLILGWMGSAHRRIANVQRAVAVITLLAVPPYLFLYGGGV